MFFLSLSFFFPPSVCSTRAPSSKWLWFSCCTWWFVPPVIIPSTCWERENERERGREGGRKKKKPVVILKSPLDAGLIIVCLVFAMAVIETLAVRVYIQHVGGSCAPCGRILIISHDRTPKQLVCTSLSLFVFLFVLFCSIFFLFPRVFFVMFCTLVLRLRCIIFMCILQQFVWLQNHCQKKKKKKKRERSISQRYWLSFKRCHPPQPRTHVVFTGRLRVDLIPAMYLVLFNSSPRLRDKQPKGSICSNVLTTFMNFSSAAQGDGLPAGWVEEMRRPFDAADHTHNPPRRLETHFKGLSPWTF